MSSYNRTIWKDSPETEITAERLNAMEVGIEQAHDGENVPNFESYDTQNPKQELVVPPIVKGDKLKDILSKLTQFCNNIRFLMGKDYIVDQGTSGIWTYRKWSSGLYECWCHANATSTNYSTTNGLGFLHRSEVAYPITFVEQPNPQVNILFGSGIASICGVNATALEKVTFYFDANLQTAEYRANIRVIGKWY